MLITCKLKFIPNYKAKQWMLSSFFKGMDEQEFQKTAKEYALKYIDTMLFPRWPDRGPRLDEVGRQVRTYRLCSIFLRLSSLTRVS